MDKKGIGGVLEMSFYIMLTSELCKYNIASIFKTTLRKLQVTDILRPQVLIAGQGELPQGNSSPAPREPLLSARIQGSS